MASTSKKGAFLALSIQPTVQRASLGVNPAQFSNKSSHCHVRMQYSVTENTFTVPELSLPGCLSCQQCLIPSYGDMRRTVSCLCNSIPVLCWYSAWGHYHAVEHWYQTTALLYCQHCFSSAAGLTNWLHLWLSLSQAYPAVQTRLWWMMVY